MSLIFSGFVFVLIGAFVLAMLKGALLLFSSETAPAGVAVLFVMSALGVGLMLMAASL